MKKVAVLCLCGVIFFSLYSCNKDLELSSNAKIPEVSARKGIIEGMIDGKTVEYDLLIEDVAKALAANLNEKDIRKLLKKEASKKFDGDFDVLFANIQNVNVKGKSLKALLKAENALNKFPLLNISIPVNIENWDENNFIPLVALSPSAFVADEMKIDKIKAFDANGKIHWLDVKVAPKVPVIVLGQNERVVVDKNNKITLKSNLFLTDTKNARMTGIQNESTTPCSNSTATTAYSTPGGGPLGGVYPNGSRDFIE